MVLLRKSIPQNYNLKTAAELGVRLANMKLMYVILISFISFSAYADFDYSSYKVEKYENAVSALEKDASVDYFIETNFSKYRVSVKYTGKTRLIAKKPKELVTRWVHSLQLPIEYQEKLSHEIQIESNGLQYWLPIQENLVESFLKEVKINSSVYLYIVSIGSIKLIPVFGICEFEAKR